MSPLERDATNIAFLESLPSWLGFPPSEDGQTHREAPDRGPDTRQNVKDVHGLTRNNHNERFLQRFLRPPARAYPARGLQESHSTGLRDGRKLSHDTLEGGRVGTRCARRNRENQAVQSETET